MCCLDLKTVNRKHNVSTCLWFPQMCNTSIYSGKFLFDDVKWWYPVAASLSGIQSIKDQCVCSCPQFISHGQKVAAGPVMPAGVPGHHSLLYDPWGRYEGK